MFPNTYRNDLSDEQKREFKRQQDRLKMMAPAPERKTVTADDMIFNLLQKSDTFKKVSTEIPEWLRSDSQSSCPYYQSIWKLVACSEKMVDTQKISQILLTSGLHPDILGFIWNLANKTVPGQLTKQELFYVLALVGLTQSGRTFNNLSVLNHLPTAPLPRLHCAVPCPTIPMVQTQGVTSPALNHSSNPENESSMSRLAALSHMSLPIKDDDIGANNVKMDDEDDFQDFQSIKPNTSLSESIDLTPSSEYRNILRPAQNIFTVESPQHQQQISSIDPGVKTSLAQSFENPSRVPSMTQSPNTSFPLTNFMDNEQKCTEESGTSDSFENSLAQTSSDTENFTDFHSVKTEDGFSDFQAANFETEIIQPLKTALPKLSSLIKVSPESERKLRQLSQPESFGSLPESKISSKNQVSSMPSIAVLAASRGVGSRLANYSLSTKAEKPITHHRHYKIKPIVAAGTSVIPEDVFQKCLPKSSSTFLLKETKISGIDLPDESSLNCENTRKIEIPSVGTFRETTFPSEVKTKTKENLLSVEEDKYRALRDLNFETNQPERETIEDFGEFLSADLQSEKAVEAWSVWNSSVNAPDVPNLGTTDNSIDSIADADIGRSFVEEDRNINQSENIDLLDISLLNLTIETKADNPMSSILKSETPNLIGNDDFGDFVAPHIGGMISPPNLALSEDQKIDGAPSPLPRYGSWTSLELAGDLNQPVFSLDSKEDTDLNVVNRCLSCCHKLLKDAVDTFNSIQDKNVIVEVFGTEEARNYLKYLNIVYCISRRISSKGYGDGVIHNNIHELFEHLLQLANDFSIPLGHIDTEDETGQPCAVCMAATSKTDLEEKGRKFHITCANLWINCIDSSLPCF